MRTTINTPEGPRIIPDWAQCYCVADHRPSYVHPYPFTLPDGVELWLCPNTYHQANTLLKLYKNLDGPPAKMTCIKFNYFVRSLVTYYWQQVLQARADEESFESWKKANASEDEYEYLALSIPEIIKKTVAHGS